MVKREKMVKKFSGRPGVPYAIAGSPWRKCC